MNFFNSDNCHKNMLINVINVKVLLSQFGNLFVPKTETLTFLQGISYPFSILI